MVRKLIDRGLIYNDGEGRNSSLHLTTEGLEAYTMGVEFFKKIRHELLSNEEESGEKNMLKMIEFNDRLDNVIRRYSNSQ